MIIMIISIKFVLQVKEVRGSKKIMTTIIH